MLDDHRDGRSWDAFLRSLIQSNSAEPLTEDHLADIAERTAKRAADEMEARLR